MWRSYTIMREAAFLSQNENKWRRVEEILDDRSDIGPDEAADLFVELTDDLSYARTHYSTSVSTNYLNALASGIYQKLTIGRREKLDRLVVFWKTELPLAVRRHHRKLFYSALFFICSVILGVASTHYDEDFPRTILGDRYVNETLANIESGDPMKIYKDPDAGAMFLGISLNNIKVASYTFIAGILFSMGTYYFLFFNGVMVGAFQYFFFQKGVFLESFLTIWIHGTIEISCLVIAGAAGITLGNSMLFPGTLPRKTSLVKGAKEALKISVGIVPLFIFAALLESFVTRHTNTPNIIRASIILGSAVFVIWYFVILPIRLGKKHGI
jgi:uncharacterized membrane protein SpoIIM required for sporulation